MPKSPTKTPKKPAKGSPKAKLNVQQLRFVEEYLKDGNGTKAAQRAGYAPKAAGQQACVLLKNPKIAERIEAGLAYQQKLADAAKARAAHKIEITEERWLREVSAVAFTDMDDFVEVTEGGVRIIPSIERQVDGRAIAKVSESRGKTVQRSLQLHNKLGALELIAKSKGFIKDRSEVTDPNSKPVRVNITLPGNKREVKPKS